MAKKEELPAKSLVAELKVIAKKHRWAFEEMAFDLCMMQANKLNGNKHGSFRYLKSRLGTGVQVLQAALNELPILKVPQPTGTHQNQLNEIARVTPWVFYDMVVEQKEEEAVELIQGSISELYRYLLCEYKNALSIMETLKWLILTQRDRRKTYHLYGSIK